MPDKEFKALVRKVLTKLGKKVDTFNENVNRELENRKKKIQSEMNTRAEVKITHKSMKSTLTDTEKHVSHLEDRIMDITQSEQQKNIFF